ncbi:MAG: hypothetical protein SGARI_003720, partial [Bacillariaceae sp.]
MSPPITTIEDAIVAGNTTDRCLARSTEFPMAMSNSTESFTESCCCSNATFIEAVHRLGDETITTLGDESITTMATTESTDSTESESPFDATESVLSVSTIADPSADVYAMNTATAGVDVRVLNKLGGASNPKTVTATSLTSDPSNFQSEIIGLVAMVFLFCLLGGVVLEAIQLVKDIFSSKSPSKPKQKKRYSATSPDQIIPL